MGRNSTSPEILSPIDDNGDQGGGGGVHLIRDRFPIKRNPHPDSQRCINEDGDERDRKTDRQWRNRSHHTRSVRKGFAFRKIYFLYAAVGLAVILFFVGSISLQSSLTSVFRTNTERGRRTLRQLKVGGNLKFFPVKLLQRFDKHGGLDRFRTESRVAIRPPRLALILGNMKKDPASLMLFTVMKSLKRLGYVFKISAVEDGQARPLWEQIGGQISILGPNRTAHVDWSFFEGVVVNSLEAKVAVSSIMQEPFSSIPLIWVVEEDILSKRLPTYAETGLEHLIVEWRSAFSRADVVVFPDFSLPMLYSVLDTGNFYVIPGSPVDVWGAESFVKSHDKFELRKSSGLDKDDLVVLVVGGSFFYDKLSWDYAVAMHAIGPVLTKFTRRESEVSFKFIFLFGNSTDGYNDALQDVASRLNLPSGSLLHYGLDGDVNSVFLMADIVLYGSFQDEQGFPPLLIRAMSFEIPVVAPDLSIIKKYVVDGAHGLIFGKHDPEALVRSFSLLVSEGKLSKFAHEVASAGKSFAKNMMASECVTGYAKLLENVIHFPSDALLPGPISQIQEQSWEWDSFRNEIEERGNGMPDFDMTTYIRKSSIVYALEEEFARPNNVKNVPENETDFQEVPTQLDWDLLWEIESSEDFERRELEELEEREERASGSWDEIYRNARKAEKLKFEANERDEGELERIGESLCIYEIYSGAGSWASLHHGSLYRGLSLSTKTRRARSDDVDAVSRLPLLNDTFYRDLLCELGGMLAIANKVDNVHKIPWIGFQSWRTLGRKVSLSSKAENALEEIIQDGPQGDVIYYWARLDVDNGVGVVNDMPTFWSMCDILNGGHCRTAFADAFRQMYGLPSGVEALPPMPEDGDHWSALHSWVMPTPSFLEFVMFSRMFADSLDGLNNDLSTTNKTCLLGTSDPEIKHCYCRVLELLVNVWAYHSARKMVYIDPRSGSLEEQHPIKQREGLMWVKFFNFTLLKTMDEDLAEAADDNEYLREGWLWPLTGEVHWQGIYEREREERYRIKMDKKRKTREKLLERQKYGYKQKTLGR